MGRRGRGGEQPERARGHPLGRRNLNKQRSPDFPAAPRTSKHPPPGRRRKANRSPQPRTEAHCPSPRLLPRSASAPRGRAVWRGGRAGRRGAQRPPRPAGTEAGSPRRGSECPPARPQPPPPPTKQPEPGDSGG